MTTTKKQSESKQTILAQWVRMLAAMSDNLGLIPRNYTKVHTCKASTWDTEERRL